MNKTKTIIIIGFIMILVITIILIISKKSYSGVNPTPTPEIATITLDDSENKLKVFVTYYGWNDNDPPGTAIAYPKSESQKTAHEQAGGLGTFEDPLTFAADPGIFVPGTLIYVPYIKKYAIMEDWCAGCIGKNHIDLWAGGDGTKEEELITCEENATREAEQIIVNPEEGFLTNSSPIFNPKTSVCLF